jgi:hypothetical protein
MDEDLAQAAVRHAIRGDEHRETLWQIRSKNRGGMLHIPPSVRSCRGHSLHLASLSDCNNKTVGKAYCGFLNQPRDMSMRVILESELETNNAE